MATYDSPRPSSQPIGSTDLAVAKDNLITFDKYMNEAVEPTNRKGVALTSPATASAQIDAKVAEVDGAKDTALIDIAADVAEVEAEAAVAIPNVIAQAETDIATAIASAGYAIVGDFADVVKVQITSDNQVYTSKSIVGYESALWRTNQVLPYTPTGSDPTQPTESGKWLAVQVGEIKAVARSLNVADNAVIYGLAGQVITAEAKYLYNPSEQTTWGIPAGVGAGEVIVSVVGDVLTTDVNTYEMRQAVNYRDSGVINVRDFGAHPTTEAGYETFDSTRAFDAAIRYAQDNNIGIVEFEGAYLIDEDLYTFTTPGDDGTVYPDWVGAGDENLTAETVYEMPVCLKISSHVTLQGRDQDVDVLYGSWDVYAGGIDIAQKIGILVTSGDLYTKTIKYKLLNFKMRGYFIARIVEGVSAASYESLKIQDCGFSGILFGAERKTEYEMETNNCYAADIVGGWWTQRNSTYLSGDHLPPYFSGDVNAVGWVDYVNVNNILQASNFTFGTRHVECDNFFDTYFYKSFNSAKTALGGRLSNNEVASSAAIMEDFIGVTGRARSILNRYGRLIANYTVDSTKTLGTHRTPFYLSGRSQVCRIKIAYIERSGLVDTATNVVAGNQFGVDYIDNYNNSDNNYNISNKFALQEYTLSSGVDIARDNTPSSIISNSPLRVQLLGEDDPQLEVILATHFNGTTVETMYNMNREYFLTKPLKFGNVNQEKFEYTGFSTFTPTLVVGATQPVIPTVQGRYKLIGKVVFFKISFFDPVQENFASGDVSITGLPISIETTNSGWDAFSGEINSMRSVTAGLNVSVKGAGTTITLHKDTSGTPLDGLDLNNAASNTFITLSGWYFI